MVTAMLWVKDALIKLFFASAFCLFIQETKAQNISGKYRNQLSEYNRKITQDIYFKENNEFEYFRTTGHTGDDLKGSGHFQFINKELVLNFDLTKSKRRGRSEITEKETDNDSITIKFEIFNLYNEPRCCGLIHYILEGDQSFTLDKKGQGKLVFPKSNKELEFTHYQNYYGNQGTTLTLNKDYIVKLFIGSVEYLAIEDLVWTYKIKKANKKALVLIPTDSEKQKWKRIK